MVGPGEIFTIFFVTLGPLKILGPFAQRTRALDDATARAVAVRAFLVALIAAVAGGFVGRALAAKWGVTLPAMTITAGVIFFLVALRQLLEQYEPAHAADASPPLPPSPIAAALRLVFPIVLTPYGIATVIVLLAASEAAERTSMIIGLLVAVMLLNLLAMLFARRVMSGVTVVVLQLLGAVLAVLQVALAVQFMLRGLQDLGVIGK